MRIQVLILLVILAAGIGVVNPLTAHLRFPKKESKGLPELEFSPFLLDYSSPSLIEAPSAGYVFVGGQNGTWFEQGQSPRGYQIDLQNSATMPLTPVRSGGTIWGGGFNGSQLLVSGWGSDDSSLGPYICLYEGSHVVAEGSLDQYGQALSWSGGDIFSASYNGKEWLLSGLGSGPLGAYTGNHMALGTFTGSTFTDLSILIPDQNDAILYTDSWNGQYWLVGGGYLRNGVLLTYDGNKFVDLTQEAKRAISNFASVQSIGWNGSDWLIGGVGFLAEYDGRIFVDLTQQLEDSVSNEFQSVNAIAWNGESWMVGGGAPIAQLTPTSTAWIATYSSASFVNLSATLPSYISNALQSSSILTITSVTGFWMIGGYSDNQAILLVYNEETLSDYSSLVSGLTYVNWVSNLQELEV